MADNEAPMRPCPRCDGLGWIPLSGLQTAVYRRLHRTRPMTSGTLARLTGRTQNKVIDALRRLESLGLAHRYKSKDRTTEPATWLAGP